jgi:hypothetical protein
MDDTCKHGPRSATLRGQVVIDGTGSAAGGRSAGCAKDGGDGQTKEGEATGGRSYFSQEARVTRLAMEGMTP